MHFMMVFIDVHLCEVMFILLDTQIETFYGLFNSLRYNIYKLIVRNVLKKDPCKCKLYKYKDKKICTLENHSYCYN